MTATTTTIKTKATEWLVAAQPQQWQQAGGGKSVAKVGSAAAQRRCWQQQCSGRGGSSVVTAAVQRRCGAEWGQRQWQRQLGGSDGSMAAAASADLSSNSTGTLLIYYEH